MGGLPIGLLFTVSLPLLILGLFWDPSYEKESSCHE
jgi:hypothetical protein